MNFELVRSAGFFRCSDVAVMTASIGRGCAPSHKRETGSWLSQKDSSGVAGDTADGRKLAQGSVHRGSRCTEALPDADHRFRGAMVDAGYLIPSLDAVIIQRRQSAHTLAGPTTA